MDGPDQLRWITLSQDERRRLADVVAATLPDHPWVTAAYLYGSAAEPGRPARDIDLGLVVHTQPPGHTVLAALARELAEAAKLPVEQLDVRIVNDADPVFLGRMLSSASLLYEADRAERIRFEVRALVKWLDFKPVWRRLRARVLERWSHG